MIRSFSAVLSILLLLLSSGCGSPPAAQQKLVPSTPGVPEPPSTSKYKAGQVWSYKTRTGEEDSTVTILKVDSDEKLGDTVHVSVQGLRMKEGKLTKIDHLPMTEEAMDKSVVKVLKESAALTSLAAYETWKKDFDAGKTGVFSSTLQECIDSYEHAAP